MTYVAFKSAIVGELKKHRAGKTWKALRADLGLPYDHPCPEWTRRMEREIGLVREKGVARVLVWRIGQN
jgi:hypothetical protein